MKELSFSAVFAASISRSFSDNMCLELVNPGISVFQTQFVINLIFDTGCLHGVNSVYSKDINRVLRKCLFLYSFQDSSMVDYKYYVPQKGISIRHRPSEIIKSTESA